MLQTSYSLELYVGLFPVLSEATYIYIYYNINITYPPVPNDPPTGDASHRRCGSFTVGVSSRSFA